MTLPTIVSRLRGSMNVVARQVLAGLLVAVLSAGVAFGQGTVVPAPVAGVANVNGQTQFSAYDNSTQFQSGQQLGAVEYWSGMGGFQGLGATFYANNGTITGNVDGNFVAQNQGQFWFGNGSGTLFSVQDPGGTVAASLIVKPSATSTAALISTGDLALIPSGGANRLTMGVPDNTIVGGNSRGAGAVDLQFTHAQATNVASGPASTIVGGANNTASGNNSSVVGGFSNLADGTWSTIVGGQNASANGRYAVRVFSSGLFSQQGDSELAESVFRASSTGGAAVRLTGNAAAAASSTCYNLPSGKTAALSMRLAAKNITTLTHRVGWFNNAVLSRDVNLSTSTLDLGTPVSIGTDTLTVSATADTTLGCLNFTVTPPNTDTWHFVLTITASEVQ